MKYTLEAGLRPVDTLESASAAWIGRPTLLVEVEIYLVEREIHLDGIF